MIKKLVLCIGLILLCSPVYALLIDQGDGTILDNTNNQLWYQNLSYFNYMTYDEQIDEILQIGSNWHMATINDMENLWSYSADDISNVFAPTHINEYSGRYEEIHDEDLHYLASILVTTNGFIKKNLSEVYFSDDLKLAPYGAWVTKSVAPVPEPTTMLLFGTGLLGLVGFGRKMFFKKS